MPDAAPSAPAPLETIEKAIRRAEDRVQHAHWHGDDPRAAEALLRSLKAAKDQGQRWNVPF